MRTLTYSCPAGISGDMNLGAMVDLGVDPLELISELEKLPLSGWEIKFSKDARKGVSGTRCQITCPAEHHHRTFATIRSLIEESNLQELVKRDAINVFRVLAEAEGRVHGKPADAVHFHEVGAVDSILDITGAAICWHLLKIDQITASAIELGSGTIQCAHGCMPVPAPATSRLVESFPVTIGGVSGEATTPTGAALLAGKGCRFNTAVSGQLVATGIGVGQRDDPKAANVVYVSIIDSESRKNSEKEEILELVTNLDDMTPEHTAFLVDTLLEAGALDAWQVPATFKKGRMGCVLSILIQSKKQETFTQLLFQHSTTLGIRWRSWNRSVLERTLETRESPLGNVRVKVSRFQGKIIREKFEFDDLQRLAIEHKLSLTEIENQLKFKD